MKATQGSRALQSLQASQASQASGREASPAPGKDAAPAALADGSGLLKIARAAAYELEIPPFACAATTLAVTVTGVENPAAQPFTVRAVLGVTYAPELIVAAIGSVTPRVAAAAGTFLLPLPPSVRELLAQRDGRLRLRIRLQPAEGSGPFQPGFKVRIAAPRWY